MATRVAELSAVITADTKGLTNGLDAAQSSLAKTAGSMRNTGMSLTELASGLSLAKQGFALVSGAVHAVIDPTVAYAKQVRDLGRSIGATTEESSKLIQAADDMQVSVASLEAGLNAAIRKGISPTIEGLGELADQYNAIQDPIARTKFLMDNFGRSGADLAPLMEKGAAGIKALGDSAELAGLVMSQEGVDSAREYELAIDQAEDSIMALKLALAKDLIPALTGVANTFNEVITVQNRYDKAVQAGILTASEMQKIQAADLIGLRQVGIEVLEVAEARQEQADALRETSNAYHALIASEHAAEKQTTALTGAYDSMIDAARDSENANHQYAASLATVARNTEQLLAAGLSGKLQDAQQEYNDVLAETTPEIARLAEHIAILRAEHGQTYTYTRDATTSAIEYENATLKAAVAVQKLSEYVGDDALELSNLKVSAEHAQESVVKLGEGMGMSAQFTLDHTKNLSEDSAAMAEMIAKQEAAEAALKKATAEFILQNAAVALGPDGMLEFARATGLISEADYNLTQKTQALTASFDTNNDSVVTGEEGRAAYLVGLKQLYEATVNETSATDGLIASTDKMPGVLEPAITAFDNTALAADGVTTSMSLIPPSVHIDTVSAIGSLGEAASQADYFTTRLDRIPRSVNVNVTTDFWENHHGPSTPGERGNYAAGVDMMVPPGYPHDSYSIGVQSGEHVVVTPAGGSGTGSGGGANTVYNFNFQNAQPVTVPNAMQTARAVSGGLY